MKRYVLAFFVTLVSVAVTFSQTNNYTNTRSATKNPTTKTKKVPKQTSGSNNYNQAEFYVGYSGTVAPPTAGGGFSGNEKEIHHGVQTSVTINANRFIGLKGDFSYGYHDQKQAFLVGVGRPATTVTHRTIIYNILGGVQFKDNESDAVIQPFGHALVGVGLYRQSLRDCRNPIGTFCGTAVKGSGLAGAFGGGLDFRIANRAGIRVVSDYNPMRIEKETINNFRFGVGVVFK